MQKQIFKVLSLTVISGLLSLTSCKTDDAGAPMITITGGNSQSQSLPSIANNGTWTNPTATAMDDEDGDISMSITVSGIVNPNTAGNYTLTYTVSDAAGNTATEVVTVSIQNDAAFLGNLSSTGTPTMATYTAYDSCQVTPASYFSPTVIVSSTVNNAFTITNFGAFGTNIVINATLSGAAINIPASQTLGPIESIIAASGTVTSSISPVSFGITYTWTDGTSNEVCISTYVHQ
jgi:trimeric autotransporter adhesin